MDSRTPVLVLRGVEKEYGGAVRTQVLFDINLTIAREDFVVVLGKSGSGKTTLLNLVGLLDTPTRGTVEMGGRPVQELSADERARIRRDELGFIFQFHHLLPDFSVRDNALMPCRIRGLAAEREAEPRVLSMLAQVGLGDLLERRPSELSGGQQQRVAIVRAFANAPRLVLADEPTGSLDSKTTEQVLSLIQTIRAESGTAFVLVTHDESLGKLANRVIELADGRIVRDARQQQVS